MLQVGGAGGNGKRSVVFQQGTFGFEGGGHESYGDFALVFVLVARVGTHIDVGGEEAVVPGRESALEEGGVAQDVGVESGKRCPCC